MKKYVTFLALGFFCLALPVSAAGEKVPALFTSLDADIFWAPSTGGIVTSEDGLHHYEETSSVCSMEDSWNPIVQSTRLDSGRPVISIVIDDMGLDRKRSARALKLPAKVTLAYLPYSPHVKKQAEKARAAGHELLVHMPMAPERASADPGPDFLDTGLPPLELHARILKNLDAFEGYTGINNHMGSRFTRDAEAMAVVMAELKLRGLTYLDSKTSPASVAEKVAGALGVQATHRDVFIDHVEEKAAVQKALRRIEYVAKRTGSAVAIGHPKDVTLEALEDWLPTLKDKGFELVGFSQVLARRETKKQDGKDAVTTVAAKTAAVAEGQP